MSDLKRTDSKGSSPSHSEAVKELRAGKYSKSAEERALELKLAREVDPGPSPLSMRGIQFTLIALSICLCSGDTGFDGSVMGAVNSMVEFKNFFGLPLKASTRSGRTGVIFSIYIIGQICSFIPASYLPDKVGRRWTMFMANLLLTVGAFIAGFAQNLAMFLVGRFLVGMGCSTAAVGAKAYLGEISSPATRGFWMGLLNCFYYVGSILASGIAVPLGRLGNNWAWRVPILLQCMLAVGNLCVVLFLPESPRWLYARGHKDQAIDILARLHSRTGDRNSPLIQLEIAEIEESISLDGGDKRWWDFRPLIMTPMQRYRTGLVFMVSVWGQLSGNGLITYFLPSLLQLAGITSPDRQRVLNFANSLTSFGGALGGASIIDRVGRRFLMLFGCVWCVCGMFITGGLLSDVGTKSTMRANAGISFIFLFMVGFSFGWTSIQGVYQAEVLSFEVRAKGLAFATFGNNLCGLLNTFAIPEALAAISWKTYFIFGAWDVVGFIVIYFFAVETRQLSLEEIDEIFASGSPRNRSIGLAKEAAARAKAQKTGVAPV